MATLLTSAQITAGVASLTNDKLTTPQISDLVSIFRGYLGDLAGDYALQATFEALDDSANGAQICAKLAACLALFQENQFTPRAGFDPTAANRTGFVYSLDGEIYEIFKYAFGLLWDLPRSLSGKASRVSTQGTFVRSNP